MNVPGYEVEGEVARSRGWSIRRARRQRDGSRVLVKAASDEAGVAAIAARLEWEYQITRDLTIDGVVPVLDLVSLDYGCALVLEDCGGVPLDEVHGGKALDSRIALELGTRLAAILSSVHREGVVHRALHPRHVLVDLETRTVSLTGFEVASRLPDERHWQGQVELTPDTLIYLAPEQTGRINRRVGRQADLYALGVLLYELLTGRLPFEADDPVELIHAHLAREPTPPHALQPELPHAVSSIVMKLLAKAAEDRYRSAIGVRRDLEACLADTATAPDWTPGRHDVSDRLAIPESLYGRERELDRLLRTFDRVASGATELLLVSGSAGIGKSALVNEVRGPIVRQRGYFISGKFDQFQRNIPHSAVISAFQELTQQLLTAGEDQIASWRGRILEAVQQNGQVITRVIPEVELIIGPQPPVPALAPAETKNRFNLVFERFIKVFARAEHPLTLFLDDLQWADTATLTLLEALATDRSFGHLLIIGAYRDNEVSERHPLSHTLAELEAAKAPVGKIRLTALSLEHVRRFVADTLKSSDGADDFARLVHEKTGGNPFFVIQFIKLLESEGRITFDHERGAWSYDLSAIREMGITENVVDLMVRKIERLPERTRDVVKLAACIGNRFDLATLTIVRQAPARQTADDLRAGVRAGLVLTESEASVHLAELNGRSPIQKPETATYRFLHDRVQQAAYALIPDNSKQVVHLQVGRLRWQHSDDATLDEQLFEIAGHLNIGASLIESEEERSRLAELNLRAGRKAKAATAYKPALSYFEEGVGLLPEDPWATHYELAFALRLELAEAAYLCGDFERAERELDRLLERAESDLDKAEIYRMRIVQCENTSRFVEARGWGLAGLALFDIRFPEADEERRRGLEDEVRAIDELVGERDIAELVDLPVMTDPAMRISMKLLMTMWAPAYISGDMMLTALVAAKMVYLSLSYGNVEESAYGYVTYAARIGLRSGDYASSHAFGRLALAVNQRFDDLTARAKVNHMFSCYIGFWREPIASCFPYSREAHRAGLSSGDFIYSAYGVYHESWHALFRGQQLAEYYEQYAPYVEFMARTRNQTFYDAHRQILQLSLALQGRTESPCSLSGSDFDEAAFVEAYEELGFFHSIYCVTKLQLLYLHGSYREAGRMADAAERLADKTEGMIWDAWRCFYRALNLAALYPELDADAQREAMNELDRLCGSLRTWSANSPANFSHRHELVAAEIAGIQGDIATAMRGYERAIAQAAAAGFTQVEALANELYARFWLDLENDDVAGLYLRAAARAYDRWGATAKVEQLVRRHSRHLPAAAGGPREAAPLDAVDVTTVMRAAQIISGEVEQQRLLERMVGIVIEVAGAQRGCLLLEREGKLLVEAEATAERAGSVEQGVPIDPTRLAASVVHYVARVGESVVLSNASRDDRFANDPYIRGQATLSLLCTPILHQGKPIGMLYLENGLMRDAFTPDRIEVVSMLASQAAISLENARLYGEMKQEIVERKQAEAALQVAHGELEIRVDARTKELLRANLRLQEEVAERAQVEVRLQEAKEVAEAASRAKSEFLASMSHELRTPLNAILGYAQILRRDRDFDERHKGAVGVIERSGEHLLTLIDDILSLSKIEAGKLEASATDFRLEPFLDGVVEIARLRAEQKGLAFRYEATTALPTALLCDERWLRQILLNLLGNAAKFTDHGGVVFRVGYLDEAENSPRLRFEVEDTGIGIPADCLEEIYEPFRQVHLPERRDEGTGLGLAISQQLVRLLGGTIGVRSMVGEGSLFTVELPVTESAFARDGAADRRVTGYEGRSRKILVVDDRAENRAVLIGLLEPLGFELAEAEDGREAVERASDWQPDLVLLDLVMPVMDGFEAARRFRRSPELANVVVVALSASVFEHNRLESLAAGCHGFVPKPVKAAVLLDCLKNQLQIEWIYDDSSPPTPLQSERRGVDASRSPVVAPARNALETLRELASVGDVQALQTRLDELEDGGEELGAFVAEMRRLADDYDMQRITRFLSPYLRESPEHETG